MWLRASPNNRQRHHCAPGWGIVAAAFCGVTVSFAAIGWLPAREDLRIRLPIVVGGGPKFISVLIRSVPFRFTGPGVSAERDCRQASAIEERGGGIGLPGIADLRGVGHGER